MATERPGKPTSSDPPDWRRLRLWHIQPVRDILVLAMVFGILYLGYILSSITVPMLLALLLAYLFEPLVQRMTRSRRIGRPGAAGIIIACFFLVVLIPLGVGLTLGIGQAVSLVRNVGSNATTLVDAISEPNAAEGDRRAKTQLPMAWESLYHKLKPYRQHYLKEQARQSEDDRLKKEEEERRKKEKESGAAPANPPAETPPSAPPRDPAATTKSDVPGAQESTSDDKPLEGLQLQVYQVVFSGIEWVHANANNLARSIGEQAIVTGQGAIAMVVAVLGTFAFLTFGAVLTAFFFFFFSTGWGKVLDFWAGLIPERKKGRAFELITKMDRVIAGFVRGRLTICGIMMVVFTLGYWFIGVPMPFLVGPLVGLLFMVPFLHILSIPLGIVLLWLQPSSVGWQNAWWWIIFAPIGVDILGQFLDDWVLSPFIQGKTTNMDMPTILFASLAGGALAGMYGLLVAIPVAACLRILVKEVFWPKFQGWAQGKERDFLPIGSADDPAHPKA